MQRRVVRDETGRRGLARAAAVLNLSERHAQIVGKRRPPLIIEILREREDSLIPGLQIERHPFDEPVIVVRSWIDLRHVKPFP